MTEIDAILTEISLLRKDVLDYLSTGYEGSSEECAVINRMFFERMGAVKTIRSRPSPAPLTMEERCKQAGIIVEDLIVESTEKHDAAIRAEAARTARDSFIDEAITACEWDHPITQEDVWRKLESLRGDPK